MWNTNRPNDYSQPQLNAGSSLWGDRLEGFFRVSVTMSSRPGGVASFLQLSLFNKCLPNSMHPHAGEANVFLQLINIFLPHKIPKFQINTDDCKVTTTALNNQRQYISTAQKYFALYVKVYWRKKKIADCTCNGTHQLSNVHTVQDVAAENVC